MKNNKYTSLSQLLLVTTMDTIPLDIIEEIHKLLTLKEISYFSQTSKINTQIFHKTKVYTDLTKLDNNEVFNHEPNTNVLKYYTQTIIDEVLKCEKENMELPKILKYKLHYIVKLFCIYNNDNTYNGPRGLRIIFAVRIVLF